MALNDTAQAHPDSTRLGCGRDVDDVWDTIDDPPNRHERSCPDCQAARESLGGLAAATHEMSAADAADPTLQSSPEVLEHILGIARAEVRRGRRIPLRRPLPGRAEEHLLVREQAIAGVIRHIGDQIPGLEIRRCRAQLADRGGDPDLDGPVEVHVRVSVSVAPHLAILQIVGVLRTRVTAGLAAEIGMDAATIDVVVEDVHDA